MADIHIFAPIPAIRKRTRLAKLCAIFRRAGLNVRYYGWRRDRNEAMDAGTDPGVTETTILRGGGYGGSRARLHYPLWMIAVLWRAARLPRGGVWYCLGFESAFPALLVAWAKRARVIFDDADRFSMIVRMPSPFHRMVVAAERWSSRRAHLHLVPGFSRYEWSGPNMRLLRNSPSAEDFAAARALAAQASDASERPFTLYVNGWVGETRGAPVFLALMKALSVKRPSARMRVVGRGDKGAFEALIRLPNVDYRPTMPQVEALALYYHSDLVLTYYDPAITINRHAESNKWGDCVYCGTPFAVNGEVETARPFIASGAAFAVDYADVDGLLELVLRCMDDPGILQGARTALRGLRDDFPPFDEACAKLLGEVYAPVQANL